MTNGNGEMETWLYHAYEELGVQETAGPEATARVIEYHAVTTLRATSDEVPWCASFVGWCLEKAGIRSTKSAAARSYAQWGYELKTPREGCIVVLERKNDPSKGHVGFYISEADGWVNILGGNQNNQVCKQAYPAARVVSYRWPTPVEEVSP